MKTLLGPRLTFDWKIVTVTIVSTLLLMVDAYQSVNTQQRHRPHYSVPAHPAVHYPDSSFAKSPVRMDLRSEIGKPV